ncbi:NADP-reducing hydrogenase subunit HndC [Streptomyces tendae]
MVNNVETLAAVPWIVRRGGRQYARRGTSDETGTKLVCLSERFARPGCYEVELGTPVRRIVTELGGGPKDGAGLTALQVGGPLGGFLAADALDVPLSEAGLSAGAPPSGTPGSSPSTNAWHRRTCCVTYGSSPRPRAAARVRPAASARGSVWSGPWPVPPPDQEWERLSRLLTEASLCAFGRRIPPTVHGLARAYGNRPAGWGP